MSEIDLIPATRAYRATLKDVAARAGVATSTASLILNRHPKGEQYSTEVRRKVRAAAEETGYRPNLFAKQLRRAENRWIMLYMTSLVEAFASQAADAFEARAAERGYVLIVSALERKRKATPAAVQRDLVMGHGVSAVAVLGLGTERQLPADDVARLADEGTACVVINRQVDHPGVCNVLVDHRRGMGEVCGHLYAQGVERITVLAGPPDWPLAAERVAAVREAAAASGKPPPRVVHDAHSYVENGRAAAAAELAAGRRPDAFVCTTDYMGYGALRACHDAGLAAGRDVAVTGFDDIAASRFVIPSLTTVHLPVEDMGRLGADLLIDALEGKRPPGRTVLPTRGVFRESGRFVLPSRGVVTGHELDAEKRVAGRADRRRDRRRP